MSSLHRFFHFIYALLLIAGGVIGYVVADSIPSLVMGAIFGILFLVTYTLSKRAPRASRLLSTYGSLILSVFFLFRFTLSWKWMPAGLMLILSLLMLILSLAIKAKKPKEEI